MYGGGDDGDTDDGVRGSRVGSDYSCIERTDPVLDSVSDPYSEVEEILVGDSRPSLLWYESVDRLWLGLGLAGHR